MEDTVDEINEQLSMKINELSSIIGLERIIGESDSGLIRICMYLTLPR